MREESNTDKSLSTSERCYMNMGMSLPPMQLVGAARWPVTSRHAHIG